MFMTTSSRSKRTKKKKNNAEKSERKTSKADKSERRRKAKKANQSERGTRKKKITETVSKDTTGGTTGSGPGATSMGNGEGASKMEKGEKPKKKEKEKEKEKELWSGEETAKKLVASGAFESVAITNAFKELPNEKPPLNDCILFKKNLPKIRAPDFPITDKKLVKLTHAPENFICAAKVTVPEFNRTMIVTQFPDVSVPQNIEDFWRMVFQEEIRSVVIALIPLESAVTLQQIFPIFNGTFANHGKMFLNNRKVDSTVETNEYTLEILPDGCSNSIMTTVYHLLNWKQKRGLDNVGDLVGTLEKVLKTNENTLLMSMNGTGRAGTMLALFTSMLHVKKGKDVSTKELIIKLRGERCGLIENAEQFGTVYRSMALWFKNKSGDEEVQKKMNEFAPCVQ